MTAETRTNVILGLQWMLTKAYSYNDIIYSYSNLWPHFAAESWFFWQQIQFLNQLFAGRKAGVEL